MTSGVSCSDLLKYSEYALKADIRVEDLISITLLLRDGYGRVAIAKKLGLRERYVRSVVEFLKKNYFSELVKSIESLKITSLDLSGFNCRFIHYENICKTILDEVYRSIVSFRDYIVVHSRDPFKIEVIGVLRNNTLEYPGLPRELQEQYLVVKNQLPSGNGIVVCWKNYRGYIDDASLIASLIDICRLRSIHG